MKNNNWLEFAQQDLRMAQIAFSEQIYNQACFHCQQAAEKFLRRNWNKLDTPLDYS
jgi:HEPN domain-containing protein